MEHAENCKWWFDSLDDENRGQISGATIERALSESGFSANDPRLGAVFADTAVRGSSYDLAQFSHLIRGTAHLVGRALGQGLIIPDFLGFKDRIGEIYEGAKQVTRGTVADYIPELAQVNPEMFAVSVCTIDGQRAAFGDHTEPFSIQSISKPITYCLALEECGREAVHALVGREPSGQSFNEITLNKQGRPHNPLINSGAILCSSLIRPDKQPADRFREVLGIWNRLCGGKHIGFNNSVYLSEKTTGYRNYALAYFLKEHKIFPPQASMPDVLDFYFQCCALEGSTDALSVVAATLANGGVCPLTDEKVLQQSSVKDCLSMMATCGMYDFSGEFAFTIGLPAKSGVAGGLLLVVPNVAGFCIWSPRLGPQGNSERGVEFCRQLTATYNFHQFDGLLRQGDRKTDPRNMKRDSFLGGVLALCVAAFQGDISEVRHLIASGVSPHLVDYSGKTPLHLACAGGHLEIVKYLISRGAPLKATDHYGMTPEDEARAAQHKNVIHYFSES